MALSFQGSFTGGELDPALSARVDLAKYGSGCKLLKNFICQPHGGVYRRPGLGFIGAALGRTRLIPFEYNVEQVYALAFSALKMRVIMNGGIVLELEKDIAGITLSNPVVVNCIAHGFNTGDDVYFVGPNPSFLYGRTLRVTRIDADNFSVPVDGTGMTWAPPGSVARLYTLTTPYTETELPDLHFAQSADMMYLCHPDHPVQRLSRTDHDEWTLTEITFGTSMAAPAGSTATWGGGVNIGATRNITNVTNAAPASVQTSVNHGYQTGDAVWITDIVTYQDPSYGGSSLNDHLWTIIVTGLNTFTCVGSDTTGDYPYNSDGHTQERGNWPIRYKVTAVSVDGEESLASAIFDCTGKVPEDWIQGDYVQLTIGVVAGAAEYNVYKERNGLYGLIGTTPNTAFRDDNYSPNVGETPPEAQAPFTGGNNPSVVTFFEQRLWFGGSTSQPQTLWASQVGNFQNFNKSHPVKDDDAMEFTLASTQVNAIRWIMPFRDLLVGTSGAEWLVSGTDDAYTPSTTRAKVQSYWGSGEGLRPIIIGDGVIHVQQQQSKIRDLFYSLEKDSYAGNDLTVMVDHLFRGKTVVDWAFQRSPDGVLWCVMSDGSLNAMTYHKEHQIYGWHHHETDGEFESVVVIRGATYDDVYFVVKRTINGSDVRYIEKLADKWVGGSVDNAIFLDSYKAYAGSPANEFSGLHHLEGETVTALADGSPVGNLVVTDGAVNIPFNASTVFIGLPYTSVVAPIGVELAGEAAASIGRVKTISKIILRFSYTVGGSVGPALDYLDALKFTPDTFDIAIDPQDVLDYEFVPPANYSRDGAFYVVQDQPLPMTLLALIPEIVVGGL